LAEDFQEALSGKFEGIGAELALKDDQLTVVAPLPDTPAERAGVLAGDLILKIDDTETLGMSVEKAVSLIRGKKGTPVKLTLYRAAKKPEPTLEVTIIRDQIQIKSVKLSYVASGTVAMIEITNFNEDTKEAFDRAVQEVIRKPVKGLVLDLRNNPGGFLDTSLMVAGEWVGQDIVVKERRQGKIFAELRGTGLGRLSAIPTVVLVNQGSASASEIVAGALQDHKKATILGMKTFGKGSVQDYQNFTDGSGVKITIAEWLTPLERTIHKTGLEPDIQVDRTPEDYEQQRDPQLERAVGILTGTASSTSTIPTTTSTKTGTSTNSR
jgi:carboxyl-terminal processing protease